MVKLEGISEELVIEMREGKAIPPPPVDTTTGESLRPRQLALHRGLVMGATLQNGVGSMCQPAGAEFGVHWEQPLRLPFWVPCS